MAMMIVGLARARSQAGLPIPMQPMLPSPALPFHRPSWIYEEKYDGWRCLAYKRGGLVRLLSRNGIDYTGRFRALAAAIALLPASTLLLDGEVTAFDEHLLSRAVPAMGWVSEVQVTTLLGVSCAVPISRQKRARPPSLTRR